MKYREVLAEVQPHYATAGLIVAVLSAAATAYSQSQQAKARNRAKRGGMNAEQMAKGGMDASVPTAARFADAGRQTQGQRLGDVLGGANTFKGASSPATQKEQGFSLGIKSLGDDVPRDTFQPGDLKVEQDAMPIEKLGDDMPKQAPQQQTGTADTAGQVGSYAQTALQLYDLYRQATQAPDPGKAAPVGPMNLQPTATRYGQRII